MKGPHGLRARAAAAAIALVLCAGVAKGSATPTRATPEFQVAPAQVVVPGFAGYGMQFNQHEYANISLRAGVSAQNIADLERKVVALQPGFVRIFIDPTEFLDPDRMASFVRTVELAQRAGAVIDVTLSGGWEGYRQLSMLLFASVLADLVHNRGITGLKWATVENEPNMTNLWLSTYRKLYVSLDHALRLNGVRDRIGLMGGDLVDGTSLRGQTLNQWFRFMGRRMPMLDAYSVHLFWSYRHPGKLLGRLSRVRTIVQALPPNQRRPLFVSEYAARGFRLRGGTSYPEPGVSQDGTPLEQTNVNAFQHALFNLLAARLGYAGLSKWDGYFGKYDSGKQDYSTIGPPQQGWPLRPVYHLIRLFTSTVGRGWNVVRVDGAPPQKVVAAYAGPDGALTVIGLDTAGAVLAAPSTAPISYALGGLPPNTALRLEYWNADDSGQTKDGGTTQSDGQGEVVVTAPVQSVFALTTLGASR
jgi:hypothetical protein